MVVDQTEKTLLTQIFKKHGGRSDRKDTVDTDFLKSMVVDQTEKTLTQIFKKHGGRSDKKDTVDTDF